MLVPGKGPQALGGGIGHAPNVTKAQGHYEQGVRLACACAALACGARPVFKGPGQGSCSERSADVSLLKFHGDTSELRTLRPSLVPHPQGWLMVTFGAKEAASLWVYFWMIYLLTH